MTTKIRHSEVIQDKHLWVVDDALSFSYVHPEGTIGGYCTYPTKALAQVALDLYLDKQRIKLATNYGASKGTVERMLVQEQKKVYGHPRFYEILEQMKELHSRKNHDYAGTSDPLKNLRACERLELKPFIGVMVRLQDKWSRLEEFVKSGKLMVKGESVIDTLLDNAVYSVLAIILYEEQQKQEAQEDIDD